MIKSRNKIVSGSCLNLVWSFYVGQHNRVTHSESWLVCWRQYHKWCYLHYIVSVVSIQPVLVCCLHIEFLHRRTCFILTDEATLAPDTDQSCPYTTDLSTQQQMQHDIYLFIKFPNLPWQQLAAVSHDCSNTNILVVSLQHYRLYQRDVHFRCTCTLKVVEMMWDIIIQM